MILDTRGYLRYLKGQYATALEDMNKSIQLAVPPPPPEPTRPQSDAKPKPRTYKLPPEHAKLFNSYPRSSRDSGGLAVLYYHRAIVLEALGKNDKAKADLAKVRALIGREPDETLY